MTHRDWVHRAYVLMVLVCALAGMNPVGCGDPSTGSGQADDGDASSSAAADDDATAADDDASDDDVSDDDATDDDTVDDDAADDDTGGCVDIDGDGYGENCPAGDDCWDYDATKWEMIHPYRDADYDTYPGTQTYMCAGMPLPNGWSMTPTDCDDADPAVNPGMFDFPDDGIDNDCANGDVATGSLNVIYVDDAGGDDANPGTALLPMKTINAGVAAATLGAADGVVVATGIYNEDVVTTVSLFGGHEAGTWIRDLSNHAPVTRVEPVAADTTILVNGAVGQMAVNGFEVQVPDGTDLARGIAIEASEAVYVGANYVHSGTGDEVVGIEANESDAVIVSNKVELGSGEHATGILHFRSYSTYMPSSIIENKIIGHNTPAAAISAITNTSNAIVISNDIHVSANSYEISGIEDFWFPWAPWPGYWSASVADNSVEIRGGADKLIGINNYSQFPIIAYDGLGTVVENQIDIEADARGALGIQSSSTSMNNVVVKCQGEIVVGFSGGCVGIESPMLGIHRQNSVWVESNVSGLESNGINVNDIYFGYVVASIVDNSILVASPASGSSGVYFQSLGLFIPYWDGSLDAEVINNNIVVSQSGDPVTIYADYVNMTSENNNLYSGTLRERGENSALATGHRTHRRIGTRADMSVDPLFVDADNGDLRLRPDSPLIDAGVYIPVPMLFFPIVAPIWNEEWNRFPVDLDGTRRPRGAAMDIGADEFAP